jgi:hypothetical protein
MTLCRLLEIKMSLLRAEDHPAVEIAERAWSKAGRPITRRGLIAFLEAFVTTAVAEGYGYPPILLRRKREMQRGDWAPRETRQEESAVEVRADACPTCKGLGFIAAANGTGSLCKPCLGRGVRQKL